MLKNKARLRKRKCNDVKFLTRLSLTGHHLLALALHRYLHALALHRHLLASFLVNSTNFLILPVDDLFHSANVAVRLRPLSFIS